jgi:hypothetical protein
MRVSEEWPGSDSGRSYARYQLKVRRSATTSISWHSERRFSKNMTNCSWKKTTGPATGMPPLAWSNQLPHEREVEPSLQAAAEVVFGGQVLK